MQRGVEDQGAEVIPNDRSIIVRLEAGDEKWCAGCGCLGAVYSLVMSVALNLSTEAKQ